LENDVDILILCVNKVKLMFNKDGLFENVQSKYNFIHAIYIERINPMKYTNF